MRWGFPYFFLSLLALLPLILLFHSLRPKGSRVKTTALFLWELVHERRPVGKRLGWLVRSNLSLLAQVAGCLALVAALAQPFLLRGLGVGGDMIVVLDLSASMKAKSGAGTRFDAARKELLSLVGQLRRGQRMMVIGAGPSPAVLTPFTTDKAELRRLASDVEPWEAAGAVKDAVMFAQSFLKRKGNEQVLVVSDGAFEEGERLPWRPGELGLVQVEGGSENWGITAFTIRSLRTVPESYDVMVAIKNLTSHSVMTPLSVLMNGKLFRREIVNLKEHERKVVVYRYRGSLGSRAEALLELEDDFSLDNMAFMAFPQPSGTKVAYIGKGNPFLDRLFHALPGIQIARGERVTPDSLRRMALDHDVIVLDGVRAPPLRLGNYILINTVGGELFTDLGRTIEAPKLLSSTQRHPLLEGIRLDDLFIKQARGVMPVAGSVVLARSPQGPLIFAFERPELKAMVIAFDVVNSDFPLKVAFPLLFANALEWMRSRSTGGEFPAEQVQAGSPALIPPVGPGKELEIKFPSGRTQVLKSSGRPVNFSETREVGLYRVRLKAKEEMAGGNGDPPESYFSANLASEKESDIRAREFAAAKPAPAEVRQKRSGAMTSLWHYFLLVAFVFLFAEALLWHHAKQGSFR